MSAFAAAAREMERSGIRALMELAAGMSGVIHLEVGEPDFATPAPVVAAAQRALDEGYTKYGPNAGLPELREALAAKLTLEGLRTEGRQVVVTPGAVCALACAVFALVDPGDEVLVPDPGWPNYRSMVKLAHGRPVGYPLARDSGYLPDPAAIAARVTARTKLLVVNSPANPTGAVFPRELVQALVTLARERDLFLLSDEVYESFVFEGDHVRPASFDDDGRVVTVSGFSKTYAMTGWRLGYAIAAPALAELIAKLQEPIVSCAPTATQRAALAALALPAGEIARMRDAYRSRRDMVVSMLGPAGILAAKPSGAFYALVDLGFVSRDADALARALLQEQRVATAPGATFGAGAAGLLRISLATAPDLLEEGCARMLRFAAARRNGAGAT